MKELTFREQPKSKFPVMVMAFAGWPDAAEVATGAVQFLVEGLGAETLAEIDSEEFHDFTITRPETLVEDGRRIVQWPANKLYYAETGEPFSNLILLDGTEPNLRWRAYADIILGVAERFGTELMVSLGSLLDAVPHTREPRVTGRAEPGDLARKMEWLGIVDSGYEGPAAIHTVLLDESRKKGLSHLSLWGHSPHYSHISPNPKASHALLQKLKGFVNIDLDLDPLREAGDEYEAEVAKAIASEPAVQSYVTNLEDKHDEAQAPAGDIPNPEALVKDLDEFLKSQGQPRGGSEG